MLIKIPDKYKMLLFKNNTFEYEHNGDIKKLPIGSIFRIYNYDWKMLLDHIDDRYILSDTLILDGIKENNMEVHTYGLPYLENIHGC